MIDFPVTEQFVKTANAAQLHDEARGGITPWPAAFLQRDDGSWTYSVDRDEVDEAAVQAALKAHTPAPKPDPEADFRKALEGATTVAQIRDALLGKVGPGAQPRNGR